MLTHNDINDKLIQTSVSKLINKLVKGHINKCNYLILPEISRNK